MMRCVLLEYVNCDEICMLVLKLNKIVHDALCFIETINMYIYIYIYLYICCVALRLPFISTHKHAHIYIFITFISLHAHICTIKT